VKKQGLMISTVCVLLSAASGCRRPVKAVVLIPDQGAHGGDKAGIYAEKGGTVEFRDETPNATQFEVRFDDPSVCTGNEKSIESQPVKIAKREFQVATCHLDKGHKDGYFGFTLYRNGKQIDQDPRHLDVRICPEPCKR
jgi:hypothetical protein